MPKRRKRKKRDTRQSNGTYRDTSDEPRKQRKRTFQGKRDSRELEGGEASSEETHVGKESLKRALSRIRSDRVRKFNEELAVCASRKQLDKAIALFRSFPSGNAHTHAIMINVFVRCGKVDRAETFLRKMIEKGLQPGIVSYTSLLKGFCNPERVQKDPTLRRSLRLVVQMLASKPPVVPNVRTCNTLLRGCLWVGNADVAENLIVRMRDEWNTKPDESSWEYLVTLLCQSLKLNRASRLARAISKALGPDSSAALTMWINVAESAALLDDRKLVNAALSEARKRLDAQDSDDRSRGTDASESAGQGGKRGWHATESRAESAHIFAAHRRAQLRRRANRIEHFAQHCVSGTRLSVAADPWQLGHVLSFWSRKDESTTISKKQLAGTFVKSLVKRFGLTRAVSRLYQGKKGSHDSVLSPRVARDCIAECIIKNCDRDRDERLWVDFGSLLRLMRVRAKHLNDEDAPSSSSRKERRERRALKMEIACGSGEWVVAQAREDADRADWVALELRHSRVHEVYTRMVFEGLRNLCVVGGDAREILRRHVAPTSVHHLFVNHPEPPSQTASTSILEAARASEGRHLLDSAFFTTMHASLCTGGRLTIVTDNEWYGRLLLQIVYGLRTGHVLFASPDISSSSIQIHAESGKLALWAGQPDASCGHAASASSYFDRLWKTGVSRHASASQRYFLYLERQE
eukprot:g964.t1